MGDRLPLVVGNWKMELSYKAEIALARSLKGRFHGLQHIEVVVCPSFPSLNQVREQLAKSELQVGAQHVHWEERGARTGAVSVHQIRELVAWCIVGHSEQRTLSGQTDEEVSQAAMLLLAHGITPVVCVGETVEERHAEESVHAITRQVHTLLSKITRPSLAKLVVAYEPIWAIGSGITPDSNEVAATLLLIRKLIAEHFDGQLAERVRILYGGSVVPENVEVFMREPGVDGVLVGGASVHVPQFADIVTKVREVAAS